MRLAVSWAVMTLAVRCLGHRRREWALAMQAEFEAAVDDGKPLRFAIGCLVGAWREMPTHDEGRFVIANHVLAIGLILPVTVMMLSSTIGDFVHFGVHDLPRVGSGSGPLLTDGNRSAVPSLAMLLLLLGAAHLRIAWSLLECDWTRVVDAARMIAALTVTLAVFSGLVFASLAGLIHASVAAIELTAILVLARWHAQLPLRAMSRSRLS
jgi:hypothetical protein